MSEDANAAGFTVSLAAFADFITLVQRMRRQQKLYFSVRSQPNLAIAKKYEVQVDNELRRLSEKHKIESGFRPVTRKPDIPNLFPEDEKNQS